MRRDRLLSLRSVARVVAASVVFALVAASASAEHFRRHMDPVRAGVDDRIAALPDPLPREQRKQAAALRGASKKLWKNSSSLAKDLALCKPAVAKLEKSLGDDDELMLLIDDGLTGLSEEIAARLAGIVDLLGVGQVQKASKLQKAEKAVFAAVNFLFESVSAESFAVRVKWLKKAEAKTRLAEKFIGKVFNGDTFEITSELTSVFSVVVPLRDGRIVAAGEVDFVRHELDRGPGLGIVVYSKDGKKLDQWMIDENLHTPFLRDGIAHPGGGVVLVGNENHGDWTDAWAGHHPLNGSGMSWVARHSIQALWRSFSFESISRHPITGYWLAGYGADVIPDAMTAGLALDGTLGTPTFDDVPLGASESYFNDGDISPDGFSVAAGFHSEWLGPGNYETTPLLYTMHPDALIGDARTQFAEVRASFTGVGAPDLEHLILLSDHWSDVDSTTQVRVRKIGRTSLAPVWSLDLADGLAKYGVHLDVALNGESVIGYSDQGAGAEGAVIVKMDAAGGEVFRRVFVGYAVRQVRLLPGGDVVVVGSRFADGDQVWNEGWIRRIDKNGFD